jgi:hypothetical protein
MQAVLDKLDKVATKLCSKIFNFSMEDFCNNYGFYVPYSYPVNLLRHFG